MSSGAGRAAAREIKQVDPRRRRVRDILEMSVIADVVREEEQEHVLLTYICV
jgi:hypothetical protein